MIYLTFLFKILIKKNKFMLFETLKILFYKYISLYIYIYIYINKTKEINTRRANKKSFEGRYQRADKKEKKEESRVSSVQLVDP